MAKVVIIQSFIKRFRVPFYDRLAPSLARAGIDLRVLFGQPDRYHAGDSDIVTHLPYGRRLRNRYMYFGNRSLSWQPALSELREADLVVVQQGSRHLLNHLLLASRAFLGIRLAFWGHGRNFQSDRPGGVSERAKRFYSSRADYWFAYTERSASLLRDMGYPGGRITVVQNAIDTTALAGQYDDITPQDDDTLRRALGIAREDVVAVYCGRFYGLKDIDFTLEAARLLRAGNDRFHLILIGDGVERDKVAAFCRDHASWAHYVGPHYGADKAGYFRLAQCQLMPGAVGLSVVDSFATLTPLITRTIDRHGPEIDYLKHGVNGLLAPADLSGYVAAVADYLSDRDVQRRLADGCRDARDIYTIEAMADRFSEGVQRAIAMRPLHKMQAAATI